MGKVDDAVATMITNLEAKTGKPLAAWVKLVQAQKVSKHGEMVSFLKSKHGLGHGYANLVAHSVADGGELTRGDDPVGDQYAGPKAGLRPIYEAILAAVQRFGADVEVSPKKANVSLRRSKQFALVQPSTATRLDVGINLKVTPPSGRLLASGSFSAMVSHRVRLESVKDVDKELIGWLKQAYDQDLSWPSAQGPPRVVSSRGHEDRVRHQPTAPGDRGRRPSARRGPRQAWRACVERVLG